MRKLVATGLFATLGLLAAPASASFEHRFTVLDKNTSFRETPDGFRNSGRLVDPREPVRREPVGHQQTKCRARPDDSAKCRGVAQLSGEVGGFGEIKFRRQGLARGLRDEGRRR